MQTHPGKPIIVHQGNFTSVYPTICFSYQDESKPHGVFGKANILQFVFPIFMLQIILTFFVSQLVYFILRPLRQPKFVCNVLAGIILGPSVLGRNNAFMETFFPEKEMLVFNTVARLGTGYAIFIIAVKMDTDNLLKSAKKMWPIGLSSYIVPFIVTMFFSFAMGSQVSICFKEMKKVFFLCGTLSVTYFPVVAQVIEELDLLTTEFGQLALSSSMFIQMMSQVITYLGVITTRDTYKSAFTYFFIIIIILLFAIYVIRPAILLIIRRTPEGKPVNEGYVIAIHIGTLLMAVITDVALYDFLTGTFLMGLIIPKGPPLGSILVEKSELMVMELFLPLFFVQVGYKTDVYSIHSIKAITVALLLVIVCCLTKIFGVLLASMFLNIRFRSALLLGLLFNFKGVVDLLAFYRFEARDILDTQCYTVMVLFNLFLAAIIYPLIKSFYKPQARLSALYSKTKLFRTLQSTPQDEELRALACVYHEDNVPGMIALLEALNNKANSSLCAYVVHVVDLVGQSAPLLIPYKSERRRSGKHNRPSSPSSRIMDAFRNYSKYTKGHVSIQPFTMVAPFKTMHNIICHLAGERRVPLIIAPFHENHILGINTQQKGSLKEFNSQLQVQAPCTVGILFDKGLKPLTDKLHNFSCRIAVLFVGGVDDREALALAIKMSGNPDVNITMFSINSAKDNKDTINYVSERQLDELLVKEFKDKNVNNPNVVCHAVKLNESLQMINVVRSVTKKYDLIIVGKNSGARKFEEAMMAWVEHPELGVIGDLLVSTDFCDDKTSSVLVMEHCTVRS